MMGDLNNLEFEYKQKMVTQVHVPTEDGQFVYHYKCDGQTFYSMLELEFYVDPKFAKAMAQRAKKKSSKKKPDKIFKKEPSDG